MPYLNISHFTDPTPLRLLDAAYILVLLPLLLVIKVPMLLYMLSVFLILFLKKEARITTLIWTALWGLLALFLSMYGAFNFSGLSRLKIFIELLIYLLIIAVTLQRMTREINIYLSLSPILLLALSLFFFHSIGMLIYVIFEIFMLLWLLLAHRMQGTWRENLRMTGMLYVISLPWVVILFVIFPRISFEHASYGFREDVITTTGHDGKMYLDNKAELVLSDRIVMEVSFADALPPSHQLYFRGTVLYNNHADHWEPLPINIRKVKHLSIDKIGKLTSYKIALYPTKKEWLYMLDIPAEAPRGATIDADFVTTLKKPINEPLHYQGTSALEYSYGGRLESIVKRAALHYPHRQNPQSQKVAEQIKERYDTPKERATAIMRLFKKQNLTYTLKPDPLDLNNSVDSFLFEKRKGYCVHFASSFVLMARMVGIPARIVTGYKANLANSVENYIVIKERDAHAWAELYIDKRWVRYETTAFASSIEDSSSTTEQAQQQRAQKAMFPRVNLYLMYMKYQVESWILEYSHFRQLQLLNELRKNPLFVYKMIALFIALLLISYALFRYFHRAVCEDLLLCTIAPLMQRLDHEGYRREERETMHKFLIRVASIHIFSKELLDIDRGYEQIRYADDDSKASLDALGESIKIFLRKSK